MNFGPRLYAVLSDEWWTIMEASVSVTDVKSYRSYSIKRRGVCQIFSVSDAAFISQSDF